ncbi:S46 family peptidase [Asaia siamensis]|uniref:Dipeptidyl-peptidase n=1 Tax=Asaia siamensis TaxID=110479 RepID=A0ABQ1M7J0_9PROT|nr:S46 family peptidase [Asaia siamensis]GBR05856.1 peptidase S46 [Asaia siamensis NRIC 0323]GGC35791.1 dipeptidyl-peptidase [Asaia siamensis]
MSFKRSPLLLSSALVGAVAFAGTAHADEGMWTFDHLPKAALQKSYGFTPDASWIQHVVQSSARLAEGCSASFVSGDGLVMTNHHCANSCLAALSDKDHDYFRDGFTTRDLADERQCPGMELDRLDTMKDVSGPVADATKGKQGAAYAAALQEVESKLTKDCIGGDDAHWRCDMVSLYHGGQTALYRYRRYKDVRVVMAPEQGIAFFGGDPDNFDYPRYDIDLSMLRVYEGGKPVHTPYLQFDPAGPKADDLVFTSGNPGRTQRGLPAAALAFQRDVINPTVIALYSVREGMLWQYGRESAEHAKQAEDILFGVQNALKSFSGTQSALQSSDIIARRAKEDADLQAWIDADPARKSAYGEPFKAVDQAIALEKDLFTRNLALSMVFGGALNNVMALVEGANERSKPDAKRHSGFHDAQLGEIETALGAKEPFYPELETALFALRLTSLRQTIGADDALVHLALGNDAPDELAARLIKGTKMGDPAARLALWKGGLKAVEASNDPLVVFVRKLYPSYAALREQMRNEVTAPLHKAQGDIARARFAQAKADGRLDTLYPDATFSPRLSYGTVKGWRKNGVDVAPFTDFAGMYHHATGSEPFALPRRWLDAKDEVNPSTHLDFVSTNDIVGGNSGSPVISREGKAVGLIFDGNLPSLAGDLYYDISNNRAVATDTSAIITALKIVYHEDGLASELINGHR